MIGFENFDLRAWVTEGLTRHIPRSGEHSPSSPKTRPVSIQKSRVVLSAAAVATLGAVFHIAWTAGPSSQVGTRAADMRGMNVAFQSSAGLASGGIPASGDPVSDFLTRSKQVIADLKGGTLEAASNETIALAAVAVSRTASVSTSAVPEWAVKLASEIAQLRD